MGWSCRDGEGKACSSQHLPSWLRVASEEPRASPGVLWCRHNQKRTCGVHPRVPSLHLLQGRMSQEAGTSERTLMGRQTSTDAKRKTLHQTSEESRGQRNSSRHLNSQPQSVAPPARGAEVKQQCRRQNPPDKTMSGCAMLRSQASQAGCGAASGAQDLHRSGRVPTAKQEQQTPPEGRSRKVNQHKGCSGLTWPHRSQGDFQCTQATRFGA